VQDKIKELRAAALTAHTAARAILEASKEPLVKGSDDDKRYDALMAEYDANIDQANRWETSDKAARELAQPAGDPPTRGLPADAAPGAATRAVATKEYREAFNRFLTKGETRALQMDSDIGGGYLVAPQQFSQDLIKFVDNITFIRQLATKRLVTNAESLGVPQLIADPADADWTTELQTGSADTTMSFGKREWRPVPLAKQILISAKLLRAAGSFQAFDEDTNADGIQTVEQLVIERLGYKFGITGEKAFLLGSGANQPLGIFTATTDGIDISRDTTCASSTVVVADDLINTKYSLKAQYRNSSSIAWALSRTLVQNVRKLKDSNGQYLWNPGGIGQASLTVGQPDTVLGLPYFESEYVPNTFTTGLYVGALGDFRYYWIADALDMTIQRLVELYAATNQIGFIGRMETDGMPVLAEAFARIKLA